MRVERDADDADGPPPESADGAATDHDRRTDDRRTDDRRTDDQRTDDQRTDDQRTDDRAAEQVRRTTARRRPASLYAQGTEPDPRFSLANERTALAWVRTALAVVAGGVGLTSLVRLADLNRAIDLLALAMCLTGGWLSVSAVLGWRRRELALRTDRPLPAPVALPWLAGAVALTSVLLAVVVLVSRPGR